MSRSREPRTRTSLCIDCGRPLTHANIPRACVAVGDPSCRARVREQLRQVTAERDRALAVIATIAALDALAGRA